MNTAKKGTVRCIIFKDKQDDAWYGVALEFNIVESGDDAEVVNFNLQEAIKGYVESQQKIRGLRVTPLNQKPDTEYEQLWNDLSNERPIPSPIDVRYFGYTKVNV